MPVDLFSLVSWLEDRRRVTDVASILEFTKSLMHLTLNWQKSEYTNRINSKIT